MKSRGAAGCRADRRRTRRNGLLHVSLALQRLVRAGLVAISLCTPLLLPLSCSGTLGLCISSFSCATFRVPSSTLLPDANSSSSLPVHRTWVDASLTSLENLGHALRSPYERQVPSFRTRVICRPVWMFSISPLCALSVARLPVAANCDAGIKARSRSAVWIVKPRERERMV